MRNLQPIINYAEHLDPNQLAMLSAILVGVGFFCLRGFGSR